MDTLETQDIDELLSGADMSVKLNVFEGPLDLLLFLIRKSEIDIYDIPIAEVTSQYMGVALYEKHVFGSCGRVLCDGGDPNVY